MTFRAVWLLGVAWGCTVGLGCARRSMPREGRASAPRFAARPGDIAFTDVSVVAMTSDAVLAHHTVVIRGDRIAAVAPSAAVTLPAGVTTIEARAAG